MFNRGKQRGASNLSHEIDFIQQDEAAEWMRKEVHSEPEDDFIQYPTKRQSTGSAPSTPVRVHAELAAYSNAVVDIVWEFLDGRCTTGEASQKMVDLEEVQFHPHVARIVLLEDLFLKTKGEQPASAPNLEDLLEHLWLKKIICSRHIHRVVRSLFHRVHDFSVSFAAMKAWLIELLAGLHGRGMLEHDAWRSLCDAQEIAFDVRRLKTLKHKVSDILDEYFTENCLQEALDSIAELPFEFRFEVVKQGISMALDKENRHREAMSVLLANVAGESIDRKLIALGLEMLLMRAGDLQNDVPEVTSLLVIFIARAMLDEAVTPCWINETTHSGVAETEIAMHILHDAHAILKEKHSSSRLSHSWGVGDGRPVEELKQAIADLIREYFACENLEETIGELKQINGFGHEVVKIIFSLTLDGNGKTQVKSANLLRALFRNKLISPHQMKQGWQRVEAQLSDFKLDAPHAPRVFHELSSTFVHDSAAVA